MINKIQIENALNYLFKLNANVTFEESQLVSTLDDSMRLGVCTGTVLSAINVLAELGYEVKL